MDRAEAQAVLNAELFRLRAMPRADLMRLVTRCERHEVTGARGVTYQVEISACWDNRATGDLRVVACVDDGGLRWFFPMCDDFIVAADGRFVGE
jgi:hypothetical protein